ncbi:MAG: ribonuclease P protein component [Bacteroidales bacterium]
MLNFHKTERLCERSTILLLFHEGRRFAVNMDGNSLKVCYLFSSDKKKYKIENNRNGKVHIDSVLDPTDGMPIGVSLEENVPKIKVLIGAPKSCLKHAVDRNRVKRLLKESFRLRKQEFYKLLSQERKEGLMISLMYTGSPRISFSKMDEYLQRVIQKIGK